MWLFWLGAMKRIQPQLHFEENILCFDRMLERVQAKVSLDVWIWQDDGSIKDSVKTESQAGIGNGSMRKLILRKHTEK